MNRNGTIASAMGEAGARVVTSAQKLVLHTGNTLCNAAVRRGTVAPGHELLECISSTLKEWSAKVGSKQEQEVLEVSPCERPCMVKAEDRDELKITAKIFLLQNQPGALKEAIEKVSEALGVAHLDTVMMALPPTSLENDPLNEHLKASWLELQQLVAAGSIASLGTSDLDVSQLETLYHWAEVKPVSNQVNLASCCVMPPELTAFAKKFDIQLLTHNDAADILPATAFESAVGDALNSPAAGWTPVWVLRYSVVIKCRGVIKCKGFLVGAWRHL